MSNEFDISATRISKELSKIQKLVEQKDALMASAKENLKRQRLKIDDLQQTLANVLAELDDYKARDALIPFTTPVRVPKIAVIIGHDELVRGAYSERLGAHEWSFYNRQAIDAINSEVFHAEHLYYRDRSGVRSAHEAIAASDYGYDAVLEFHFNAFSNPQAHGAEILMSGGVEGIDLASKLLNTWTKETSLRNRGVKYPAVNEAGHFNVTNMRDNHGTDIPYLLLEPFFGTNANDCRLAINAGNLVRWFYDKTRSLLVEQQIADAKSREGIINAT